MRTKTVPCAWCGADFQQPVGRGMGRPAVVCSEDCGRGLNSFRIHARRTGQDSENKRCFVASGKCNGCGRAVCRPLQPSDAHGTMYCTAECRAQFYRSGWHKKRLRQYGVTQEQFDAAFAEQGGVCAICKEVRGQYGLVIDHCHDTGGFRALLCGPCNSAIGLMKDDPGIVAVAAAYLAKHHRRLKAVA